MLDLYINTNPVCIHIVGNDGEIVDKLIFKFPTKWIASDTVNSGKTASSLFSNKNTSSKYTEDVKVSGKEYSINHMNLLPYTTIEELKYIVASILKTDYKNILKVYANDDINYVIEEDAEKCKDFKWIHTDERLTDYESYENTMSIGYKSVIVEVLYSDRKLINNYDYKFFNNYLVIREYIEKMVKDNKNKF